jgi:hypothetical protein
MVEAQGVYPWWLGGPLRKAYGATSAGGQGSNKTSILGKDLSSNAQLVK